MEKPEWTFWPTQYVSSGTGEGNFQPLRFLHKGAQAVCMRSPEEGIHLCSRHDMREFGWNVLVLTGEGNGNPPQYSCLEKSHDRGAWWANSPWGHKRVRHD